MARRWENMTTLSDCIDWNIIFLPDRSLSLDGLMYSHHFSSAIEKISEFHKGPHLTYIQFSASNASRAASASLRFLGLLLIQPDSYFPSWPFSFGFSIYFLIPSPARRFWVFPLFIPIFAPFFPRRLYLCEFLFPVFHPQQTFVKNMLSSFSRPPTYRYTAAGCTLHWKLRGLLTDNGYFWYYGNFLQH